MARINRISDDLQQGQAMGLNECGRQMNDFERLQAENEKLRYQIQEQERELLGVYRKLAMYN